jgi:hypothetical protein
MARREFPSIPLRSRLRVRVVHRCWLDLLTQHNCSRKAVALPHWLVGPASGSIWTYSSACQLATLSFVRTWLSHQFAVRGMGCWLYEVNSTYVHKLYYSTKSQTLQPPGGTQNMIMDHTALTSRCGDIFPLHLKHGALVIPHLYSRGYG